MSRQNNKAFDTGVDGWLQYKTFAHAAINISLAVDVGGWHDYWQRAGGAAYAAEVTVAVDVGFVPVTKLATVGVEGRQHDFRRAVAEGVPAVLIVVVVEEGFFVNVVRIEIAMTAQKMFGTDEVWIIGNVDEAAVQARDVA